MKYGYTFSWVEMGHHALAYGSTSLGWGSNGSIEMEERKCGWLEKQRSQGIHGNHNNIQGRSCLRVIPHPLFIDFSRGFRVLSPWSGL